MLRADGISVSLGGRQIISGVHLSLTPGGVTALVGPNGSGKSTLLKALGGLVPFHGSVTLDGLDLQRLSSRERASLVSLMPQSIGFDRGFTVRQVVTMGLYPLVGPFRGYGKREAAMAEKAMADVGVLPLADREAATLSGGESARVALARAMARVPKVLLLDEPTAALDPKHAVEVMALLDRVSMDRVVLVVLHDINLALGWSRRVIVMREGRIIASMDEGRPDLGVLEAAYQVPFSLLKGDNGEVAVIPASPSGTL
ncbi:ABC-type cobalamin/Fe3+-siderophore transport system, ATPase component [Thermanaerovibrio velox DSM 12556]|uniref:ABC-type cobalamin/Fe3+-siderophore transport system, ATPase component n=1 Tax=Thermanaerovibrio velox DSM 12556 TaxID=926567 RepID=H0UNB8_9BACT|nr:ABC transporter ATP-binding protein [Thermanaerovibrio velox]EHM10403.1 ABC-type cobalamin/Fe3+-siderophore transport system, ATPase component [Thermanaerovibrio velox DSM 12556]